MGMQQLMGFFPKGRAHIFRIKFFDSRIVMGKTQRPLLVQLVKPGASYVRHLHAVQYGLSPAAHTAAGQAITSTKS